MTYQLHAADPMGAAAHRAAMVAGKFEVRLLGASKARRGWVGREEALRRALVQWPLICRAMGALVETCPDIAADAFREAEQMIEIAERGTP